MLRISLVPDTNMLISNLDFITYILSIDGPFCFNIFICKIIIEELDQLKNIKPEARTATNFILANLNKSIELEGYVNANKVQVEITGKGKTDEKNNDDKILNYALKQENPVILTNDNLFIAKCMTFNIPVFCVYGKDYLHVTNQILNTYGIQLASANNIQKQIIIQQVCNEIENRIKEMVYNEFGNLQPLTIYSRGFLDVLNLVIDHYNIFTKYLPKYAKSNFIQLKNAIKTNEIDKIDKQLKIVAAIFGIIYSSPNQFAP